MPERTIQCDECGNPARQAFGEGGMGWYESFHCPSCGQRYETDGRAPIPDEFRQFILQEDGEWVLDAHARPSVELMKAFRGVLSLSLSEVQRLRDRLPGEVRRGTKYEMSRLLSEVQKYAPVSDLVVRRIGEA